MRADDWLTRQLLRRVPQSDRPAVPQVRQRSHCGRTLRANLRPRPRYSSGCWSVPGPGGRRPVPRGETHRRTSASGHRPHARHRPCRHGSIRTAHDLRSTHHPPRRPDRIPHFRIPLVRTHPERTHPVRTHPVRTFRLRTTPARTGPGQTSPGQTSPGSTSPGWPRRHRHRPAVGGCGNRPGGCPHLDPTGALSARSHRRRTGHRNRTGLDGLRSQSSSEQCTAAHDPLPTTTDR